jgi:hypothetical protein
LLPILAGGKDVVQSCEDEVFADNSGPRAAALVPITVQRDPVAYVLPAGGPGLRCGRAGSWRGVKAYAEIRPLQLSCAKPFKDNWLLR